MLILAVIACMALLTSCGANRVSHTGDLTGSIYGVWALESKSVGPAGTVGQDAQNQVDYSGVHFYLSLSEPRIALAKKGSFTQFDLKDVDVDGSQFSFNASQKRISFTKTLETCPSERSMGRKDRLFLPPIQIINQDFDITCSE